MQYCGFSNFYSAMSGDIDNLSAMGEMEEMWSNQRPRTQGKEEEMHGSHHGLRDLTGREQSVLSLLAEGKTDSEIADTLGIHVCTTNTHVSNILGKLGVQNRVQAAVRWDRYTRRRASAARRPPARRVMRKTVKARPEEMDLPFTDREQEVLVLLAKGYTNQRVARALNIGARTAAFHVENVLEKLAVSNRTEAVVRAIQLRQLNVMGFPFTPSK